VSVRTFSWAHGEGEIQTLGGMLGPVRFRLPGGRVAQPFHVAPWAGEPGAAELPGILRRLRGEWPCIPFGVERGVPLADAWADIPATAPEDQPPHGHGANAEWSFGEGLALAVEYPADSPVARLERRIRPDPGAPALDVDLDVHVRRDAMLPIGLHPTFRVPDQGVVIETESGGMTFPSAVEPDVSVLAEGTLFERLDGVPLRAGGTIDISRLPLRVPTEELVQLTRPEGHVALVYPAEGFRVRMTWDASHFPGLAIWVSNRGRPSHPWSGRHQAVGLEPVCAAFDLGARISARANPLSRMGHPTARAFRAGEVFRTTLRIEVSAIEG
jgi:hypothetical protein